MPKQQPPKLPKGKWMKAAELIDLHYFFVSIVNIFTEYHPEFGYGTIIKHYASLLKKGSCPMLFLRREFDKTADFLTNKMTKNPEWAAKMHRIIKESGQQLFQLSEIMQKTDFRRLTNQQILQKYQKTLKQHQICHLTGSGVNWLFDAEKERFSNTVSEIVRSRLNKQKIKLDQADVFSILTTPLQKSFIEQEGEEFLLLAEEIRKRKNWTEKFRQNLLDKLKKFLEKNKELNQLIQKHYRKWRWTNYVYTGPPHDLDYYLERLQALFQAKENPKKILQEKIKHQQNIQKRQKELLAQLNLSAKEKKIIALAKEAVWLKGFRKDVLYHAQYGYEPMLREIARRNQFTLKQVRALCQWEIKEILQGKKFSADMLNQRHEYSLMYSSRGKFYIFLGEQAKKIYKNMDIEKVKTKGIKKLKGTCAQPGQAQGTAKIVNRKSDNQKVKKGDIMVSHTTSPDLVPAMKKAAAIVTEAGGLTCHAAIVSRELETPCVVGTLIAAKVLKDGDKVSVDASKGIVKKI